MNNLINVKNIISCLEKTPGILINLLNQIPEELYRKRRVSQKWSIHQQVCHLVDAQKILIERFQKFETKVTPHIKNYAPEGIKEDYYLDFDMSEELSKFPIIRDDMVKMLLNFDKDYWIKTGTHDLFSPYNTQILLSHTLNVDYAHLFSIEQLGLTKEGFESDILTIP